MDRRIERVLVANRGEIAVRVIRACRELGVHSIAVYSEADRLAEHVKLADEAHLLGAAPAAESYLSITKVVEVARQSGADAVHPGYGFLSENRELVRALDEAGIALIGPSVSVMASMGDKMRAREIAEASGVPVVPGLSTGSGSGEPELEELHALARRAEGEIGLPLLVKAALGGGGKGMRVVRKSDELEQAVSEASREAKSAFGSGALYFERFLDAPRHIEFQVFGDAHGNVCHLGERECSVQRRHQKLIEETPSTAVSPELRERMGAAAVALAREVGYVGAGTIEFLLAPDGQYYFIEMNTRLQVEHTITEMVTGLDLVKEQLTVAGGAPLSFDGASSRGHSIQCRISAEDVSCGFAPSTGKVLAHRPPRAPQVRVDDGLGDGGEISLYYDPMFAKLVVWGRDRDEAIARMRAALDQYLIVGVHTTIPFHQAVLADEEFCAGRTDITYVERRFEAVRAYEACGGDVAAGQATAIAAALELVQREHRAPPPAAAATSPWRTHARAMGLRRGVR